MVRNDVVLSNGVAFAVVSSLSRMGRGNELPAVPDALKTDVNRRQAVKLVARAAERLRKAQSEQRSTIRFASEVGASLREIAGAAGVSHMTVKTMLEAPGSLAPDP